MVKWRFTLALPYRLCCAFSRGPKVTDFPFSFQNANPRGLTPRDGASFCRVTFRDLATRTSPQPFLATLDAVP